MTRGGSRLIHRVLGGTIAALLVAGALAAPVGAARPTPASTTTMSVNGCDFTVTYTWSGQKGRDLIATFGVYQRTATLDISIDLASVEGVLGKSGSVTHTFNLTPNASGGQLIVARGALYNSRTFQQVAGSSSVSGTVFSTCG